MEKNDLKELFGYVKNYLKNDSFCKRFFVSLCNNFIFYNIENDKLYEFKIENNSDILELSKSLSSYINKELFTLRFNRDYHYFDFIRSSYLYETGSQKIKDLDVDSINGIIILKNNKENIEYIRSISRDYKLKNIVE